MESRFQKILITGASGSLSSQLIHELVKTGIRPIAHVRESSDTTYIDSLGLEKRVADLRDTKAMAAIVEGVDAIIHTAAWVNFRQDRLTQFTGINTMAAVELFKAAQKAGVKRFLQISTVAAIGAHPRGMFVDKTFGRIESSCNETTEFNLGHLRIPYIMTKRAADDELLKIYPDGETELVIVHPPMVVVPSRTGDDRGKARKKFPRVIAPDFPNWLNLVDIRDVVPGIISALERGRSGEKYILAGDNITCKDLMLAISAIIGKAPHLLRIPRRFLRIVARFSVFWARVTGKGKISFYPDIVRMLDFDWAYSSAKARSELGYSNRSIHVTLTDLLTNNMLGTWRRP